MSVADQINRIKTNIANTYTAAQAKGATMPQTQNSDNLAACVQSISTGGGGGGAQFGLTAEQMLGTLDGDGNLTLPTLPSITFTGLKSIPELGYYYKFCQRTFETGATVSFPDLINVGTNGMYSCFSGCASLTSADLSALTTVGDNGLDSCFVGCSSLANISFPALTDVQTNSFGTASYAYCFSNCTALTEIHFRADAQTAIGAMTGYADKWGATNASIMFDL